MIILNKSVSLEFLANSPYLLAIAEPLAMARIGKDVIPHIGRLSGLPPWETVQRVQRRYIASLHKLAEMPDNIRD